MSGAAVGSIGRLRFVLRLGLRQSDDFWTLGTCSREFGGHIPTDQPPQPTFGLAFFRRPDRPGRRLGRLPRTPHLGLQLSKSAAENATEVAIARCNSWRSMRWSANVQRLVWVITGQSQFSRLFGGDCL